MDNQQADHILHHLRATLSQAPDAPLAPDIARLLVQEPAYRGALVMLLTQMLALPPAPGLGGATDWFDDLDAFFDLEMETGIKAAAYAYPHVWWALWDDDACLATYLALRELHFAVERHAIAPLRLLPTRTIDLWTISRQVLSLLFPDPATPALHLVWRGTEHETVLAERTLDLGHGELCQVTLSAQPGAGPHRPLTVRAVPPPAGWFVLTLGEQQLRARFDAQGHATIATVPASRLVQADGPALQVHLEVDAR